MILVKQFLTVSVRRIWVHTGSWTNEDRFQTKNSLFVSCLLAAACDRIGHLGEERVFNEQPLIGLLHVCSEDDDLSPTFYSKQRAEADKDKKCADNEWHHQTLVHQKQNESGRPTVHTNLGFLLQLNIADIKKIKVFDKWEAEITAWWDKCVFTRANWGNLGFSSSDQLPVWAALGDRVLYLLNSREVLDGFVMFQDTFLITAPCSVSPHHPNAENTRVSKELWLYMLHGKWVLTALSADYNENKLSFKCVGWWWSVGSLMLSPAGSVNSLTQIKQSRTNLINAATQVVKYDIYTCSSHMKTHTHTQAGLTHVPSHYTFKMRF